MFHNSVARFVEDWHSSPFSAQDDSHLHVHSFALIAIGVTLLHAGHFYLLSGLQPNRAQKLFQALWQ